MGIAIECTGDQNYYYCILGNRVVKSQLIEQLHSEIDKHLNEPARIVRQYDIEYMQRTSDQVYFTSLLMEVSDEYTTLIRSAERALKERKIPVTRVISVR